MMKAPIFARVRPKSIKLTEKYNFSIEIDSINDNVECSEEAPEGCLEIHIPYDGVEFVNQQTFKDVKRQAPKRLQDEQAEIRIGYLGFSHYECTDILDNLKVNSTDVLPLDIPIKSKKLADQQNGGNHFACRFRHEYTPQWPEMVPLYLTINVLEENTEGINETLLDLLAELTPEESETWSVGLVQQKSRYENEIAEKIESLLKKHTHFKPLLRFYFNIRLDLPRHFCPDIDDEFDVIDDSDDDSGDTEDQSAQGEDRNNEADSDKTTNQDNE
ncbi:MAG: hypothetical protein KDE19_20955, partial [Caldilineaceae bacterium]|nr:hypothetical protein [Caldilineaceae bacterium]